MRSMMPTNYRVLCFVTLGLTALSCGGGGMSPNPPVEQVPVVQAVEPTGAVGAPGATATFLGTASNAPTTWLWDFGAGATPRNSSAATPSVTLGATGDFAGSVRASNATGQSDPFVFSYRVTAPNPPNVPVITAVMPSGTVGESDTQITFSATAERAITWFWDFGDGSDPPISTRPAPEVTLLRSGTFQASLVARNTEGASLPFPFEYTVTLNPAAPVITITSTLDPIGLHHDEILVAADTTNGPVNMWDWNFFSGAEFVESEGSAARIGLRRPGLYSGTVQVRNACCGSDLLRFNYRVEPSVPPTVLAVTPSGIVGESGTPVRFSVQIDQEPKLAVWKFPEAADALDLAPEAIFAFAPKTNATLYLGDPGTHTGQVLVTSRHGSTAITDFDFTITGPAMPAWQTGEVESSTSDYSRIQPVIHDGHLVLVYRKSSGSNLMIARGLTANPVTSADWHIHSRSDGLPLALAVIDGELATLHIHGSSNDPRLYFSRTINDPPLQASDWAVEEIGPARQSGTLHDIDGTPVAIYNWAGEEFHNPVARLAVPSGDGLPWAIHTFANELQRQVGELSWRIDAVVHAGKPVVMLCRDGPARLLVAFGTAAVPASLSDWTIVNAGEPQEMNLADARLTTINGKLALTYAVRSPEGVEQLRVALATVDQPTGQSDWSISTPSSPGIVTRGFEALDGRPLLLMRSMVVARSTTSNPHDGDWRFNRIAIGDAPQSALVIDGSRAIVVYEDRTVTAPHALRIAFLNDPW